MQEPPLVTPKKIQESLGFYLPPDENLSHFLWAFQVLRAVHISPFLTTVRITIVLAHQGWSSGHFLEAAVAPGANLTWPM